MHKRGWGAPGESVIFIYTHIHIPQFPIPLHLVRGRTLEGGVFIALITQSHVLVYFFTENGTSVDIPDFFLTPTLMTNKTVKVNSLGRDQSELCFQSKIIYVS